MSDTMRIERPLFCRREKDNGGRIKYDSTGNAMAVKTRVSDSEELPEISFSSIPTGPAADAVSAAD